MNEISLNEYFLDNSNSIIDNSSIIIIDNCRNSLDFLTKLKFEDSGVYQFNNKKARFKMKVDMLYSDPSSVTIDNSSTILNVVNNSDITRNEDFIITSLDNNIHIVTDITKDKKIQLWGNVVVNDELKVYNDASFNRNVLFEQNVNVSGISTMSYVNISGGNIDNTTISGGNIDNTTISGGNIDNTIIGLTLAAPARFTTLNVSSDSSLNNVVFDGSSVMFSVNNQVYFDKCEISLSQTTIDGSNSTIENTAIGSSHPNTGTFTNILGSHLDISSIKVYDLSNDVSISNLQFLKIDMDSSHVCYGDIDLSSIFNELDNKINESNENAGLILDPSNITISNELIVNGDASFNGDVKILNGRLYFY
tara:strand:+ start:4079 stop:5170 length:1092 start_codon:yes stop_codon:yes gene_type:complete